MTTSSVSLSSSSSAAAAAAAAAPTSRTLGTPRFLADTDLDSDDLSLTIFSYLNGKDRARVSRVSTAWFSACASRLPKTVAITMIPRLASLLKKHTHSPALLQTIRSLSFLNCGLLEHYRDEEGVSPQECIEAARPASFYARMDLSGDGSMLNIMMTTHPQLKKLYLIYVTAHTLDASIKPFTHLEHLHICQNHDETVSYFNNSSAPLIGKSVSLRSLSISRASETENKNTTRSWQFLKQLRLLSSLRIDYATPENLQELLTLRPNLSSLGLWNSTIPLSALVALPNLEKLSLLKPWDLTSSPKKPVKSFPKLEYLHLFSPKTASSFVHLLNSCGTTLKKLFLLLDSNEFDTLAIELCANFRTALPALQELFIQSHFSAKAPAVMDALIKLASTHPSLQKLVFADPADSNPPISILYKGNVPSSSSSSSTPPAKK